MASEEERDNFFSLTLLLFRNGNQRLREYFKTQWPIVYQRVKPGTVPPPWQDTPVDATEMKKIQPTKLNLKYYDERKFDSGNTKDWDFSLLTTVLRYSSLHFVLPGSPECKGLDELKAIRNTLVGHATDAAIPNDVFNTEWTKACNALTLFNATAADFKAVQDDVKKPLDVLYPMLEQCIRQEKEIQDAVDTIFRKLEQLQQEQERMLQGQSSLQQGQERIMQGQSSLQQGQERIMQGQSSLQQGQERMLQGQSSLQQGQERIMQGQSCLQQGQERIMQGQSSLQQGQERIMQGQETVTQGQSSLQHGQERITQGQSSLQQGQERITQGQSKILSVLIVVAGCILYGQYKENYQAALVSGLIIICLLPVLWYLINWAFMFAYIRYCSKALKSCIKGCTEYLPRIMTSHDITSAKTDDIFTNQMVYYDKKQVKKRKVEYQSRSEQLLEYSKRISYRVKEYIDIFIDTVRNINPKTILLLGKPGIGKSLLCLKIPRDWAFNNFRIDIQFVYLLTFRQLEALGDKKLNFLELLNCSVLLDEHSVIDDSLLEYLMKNPSKVLFILDGYDEYSRQHREEISNDNLEQQYPNNPREKMPVPVLCSKLIRRKIFRDSVVLISSRPGEAEELGKIHFDRYVEVAGFSSEQVTEFVEKYFSKPEEEETKKTVREHIEKNENLVSFCHIPLLCLLLCWCLEWRICQSGNTENLPAKIIDIYGDVVQVSLEKLHAKLKYDEITKTVKPFVQKTLITLEQLSVYLLKQKKYIFTEEDMKESYLTQDEIENLKISGILHSLPAVRISAFEVKHQYSFTHLTIMEYLAACFFVKNQEVPDTKEASGQTLVFMSGLLSKEKDEQLMKKLMKEIKPGDEYDDVNRLLTLQCLYDYGDDELSKLTINNLQGEYGTLDGVIGFGEITDVNVQCLSYLLNIIHLLLQEHHVQSCSPVHTLDIVNSSLTSCGVGVVCKSLVHHSYITRLALRDCSLDDNSVEVITNSLLNTKITRLYLSFNNITDKAAESILSVLLHDNCCVERLYLHGNKKITEECKERLRKLVQEKKPHFKLHI